MKYKPDRRKLSLFVATGLAVPLVFMIIFSGIKNETIENKSGDGLLVNLKKKDNKIAALKGEIEFYRDRLLEPADFKNDSLTESKSILTFPDTWNGKKNDGQKLPGRGHATYRTDLYFDTLSPMALKIKDYCISYKLWINGELIAKGGNPGKSQTETTPVKVNKTVEFMPNQGSNELILQTANYSEKYAGFRQPILIGTVEEIQKKSNNQLVLDAFMSGLLFISFAYYIGLYIFSRWKKAYLYFGLLVFFIFLRQFLLSDISVFDNWIQQNLYLYLKITIASAGLTSLMLYFLFRSVFPELLAKNILYSYSVFIMLFCIFIFVAPFYYVSAGTHLLQFVILAALAYILYLAVKSFTFPANGRYLISVGILFFLFAVIIEAFIFNRRYYSEYILHYGLVLFILFESYAFGIDFFETIKQNIKLNIKLETHNKNLQKLVNKKINEATEAKERELFSVVLQKASTDKLLLKLKDGLNKLNGDTNDDGKMISELKNLLQQSAKHDEIDNHLLHFKKIHPYFFENLQKMHPSLTKNELKLCAYLKLNMSYKDIANILHVRPESVRKANTRMCRKMGLESNFKIPEYLNSIKSSKEHPPVFG